MFNSVALSVVIGLIFIYLLYSLLGTILLEILANVFHLRAKNLEKALFRMLTDHDGIMGWAMLYRRIREAIYRLSFGKIKIKTPAGQEEIIDKFYENQRIKTFGEKNVYGKPSYIPSADFAKTVIDILKEEAADVTLSDLNSAIDQIPFIAKEAKNRLKLRVQDADNKLDAFRTELENWYDQMMGNASAWYKAQTQKLLLIIGFIMAIAFNVNSIEIAKTLSKDPQASDQMIQLATAMAEMDNSWPDSSTMTLDTTSIVFQDLSSRMAYLVAARDSVNKSMKQANSILGLGWAAELEASNLTEESKWHQILWMVLKYSFGNWRYFVGFLITGMAISLGAPFWFDLLKKIVSVKDIGSGGTSSTPAGSGGSGNGSSGGNQVKPDNVSPVKQDDNKTSTT